MNKIWMLYFSVTMLSVIQIPKVVAAGCHILSVTSPSASSLKVVWSAYSNDSVYVLDFRVVNSTTISPLMVMQRATSTEKVVQGLRPGFVYGVTLRVLLFWNLVCKDTQIAMTVPAAPQITFSEAVSSTSIRFEWTSVMGAVNYTLIVEEFIKSPAQIFSKTFTASRGQIDGLTPFTIYSCKVYASNSAGTSAQSNTRIITTLVRPPTDVKVVATRRSTARVTWSSVDKVLLYQVTVSDNKNPSKKPVIRNTTTTSMDISNLEPCSNYTVEVSSFNFFLVLGEASTVTYTTTTINSVTTVSVNYSCSSGMVTVSWDLVFDASWYRATAVDSTGASRNCTSASSSCQISMLKCGEKYKVHVTALADNCSSTSNISSLFETVPCIPANPQTSYTCTSNVVIFSWQPTNNTLYYVATSVDNNGIVTECRTPDNVCYFTDAACGQNYTYRVYAVTLECNTEVTQPVTVQTSPCLPTNVTMEAVCAPDRLAIHWDYAAGALSYFVEAKGNTKESYNCTSSSNSCEITDVPCGEHLSVWIVAFSNDCSSPRVLGEVAQTVPCTPNNVTVSMECSQTSARLEWMESSGVILYVIATQDANGNSHSYISLDNTRVIDGLRCGQNYTASVVGTDFICNSTTSQEISFMTAPCSPQSLAAMIDCSSNSLLVSWNASLGATSYTAKVMDPDGFSKTCSSSDLTCSFSGLQCATQHNVTVSSLNSRCTSAPIQTAIMTGPCDSVNVTSVLHCGSDMATVSWVASAGAVSHTVLAQEGSSRDYISCRTNTTSCQLKQLQCGKVYNLTVMAEDATCNSTGAIQHVVMTAPCPPSFMNSTLICGTNSSFLSWTPVADATGYTVNATALNGHKVSCSSATASCTLTDLQCSETYKAIVTAHGNQCDSAPGTSTKITTAPCSPVIISKQYTCGTNTAVLNWTDPAGVLSFLAQVEGEGHQDGCHTTNTSCVFENLPCDLDLNVTVQAQGAQCNSSLSVKESLATVPCAPENVSATLLCFNHSALVTWVGSPSAIGYNVIATAQDGHTHHCHTNSTSCQVLDIHCGETYSITVIPFSQTCTGNRSAPYSFKAGLCAPGNITVFPACEGRTVSWSRVKGADVYIATATADDGHTHTCSSNYSNSCNFTDLHCGETYAVTVVTVDRGCWIKPSSAVHLRTALCPPTNLTGHISCDSNTLTLTWNPVTGAIYVLQYKQIGSARPHSDSLTSNSSHTLSNLLCGQRYAFRIVAQDGNCRSSYGPHIEISTAPCQPTNLTVRVDCGTNNGNFSWDESSSAGFYIVQVTGEHGHVASCSSNDTSCAVKLHCGRSYSATLVASTESCNSSKHTDIYFDSAPCLPENVVAELDCNTNVMNVSWSQTPGSDNYTAWAISSIDEHRASCNSTSNSCSIHDLQCGKVYEVVVTSSSVHCEVIAGSDYKVQSAPCKPENTTVNQNCSSSIITVKWNQGNRKQNYTVKATSASGVMSTCGSTESSCSFLDLSCGQLYTFTVMGHTNVCMSEWSTPTEKLTGPCPPTSVSAELNCTTYKALVSWSNTAANTGYMVQATSANGHSSNCSEMGTSCYLNKLVCGQEYSVVVEAVQPGCPGPASAPVTLTTEPCVPMNVNLHYNVSTAQVQWSAASGASSYSVQAVTKQGLSVTCNTTNANCALTGLKCSQTYNITVTAQNLACSNTVSSAPYRLVTEPCPPTNVQASMSCEQLTSTVSWQQSDLALGYVAYFDNQHGQYTSCMSTNTSCMVSGLMCSTVYSVWVKALGQQYNSSDSSVVSLTSAPCLPKNMIVEVNCTSDSAVLVSWNGTYGTTNISLMAAVGGSLQTLCTTQQESCNMTSLNCGETYNLKINASNGQCSLTTQALSNFTTRPCPPKGVAVSLQCSSRTAVLSWERRSDVELYTASAIKASGGEKKTCDSVNTTCQFSGLDCGKMYNFTVTAHNRGCCSQPSSPVFIQTEPCPPISVSAEVLCESEEVKISWHQASNAENFLVTVRGSRGYVKTHNTTQTLLRASLPCGQDFNVTVQGQGSTCDGSPSSPALFKTAPCIPRDVATNVECEFNVGSVSWRPTDGAETYIAVATGLNGHTHHCVSNTTSCTWSDLHCGEKYTVVVRAKRHNCTSLLSNSSVILMVPCVPTNVSLVTDCANNTAVVSWSASQGAVKYSVMAHSDHFNDSCQTSGLSCSLNNLTCGSLYTIQVVAMDDSCSSVPSWALIFNSSPCPPQNMSAQVSCSSNNLMISWDAIRDTDHFLVSLAAENGESELCNTTNTVCSISNATCGKTFTVQVTSVRGDCRSMRQTQNIQSAPCQPRGIKGSMDCVTNSAQISWLGAPGADSYTVSAVGRNDYRANCTTSTNTTCEVKDLACGVRYNFSVRAKNNKCESQPSAPISLQTAPCSLSAITAVPQCHNSTILVVWDLMEGSQGNTLYTATAEADDHTFLSCNNSGTSCSLQEARCGLHYTIIVAASSDACSSMRSPPSTVSMEPCPPTDVKVNAACEDHRAMVSWTPSPVAETYHVVAEAADGHKHTCNTSSTNCSLSELRCDKQYTVFVTAKNENCSSKASQNVTLNTGPCQPRGLSVTFKCNNQSATLTWTPSRKAKAYYGCAQAGNGVMLYCHSTNPSCAINGLNCGTVYNFSVQASDGTCNSSFSDPVEIKAVPCPPDIVGVQLFPMQKQIQVMRFSWTQVTCGDTEYLLNLTGSLLGDSQVLFELSSYWTNVTYFEFPLPCSSNYSATMKSRNVAGTSNTSMPIYGTTAPCPPSGGVYRGNSSFATISWNASVFAVSYTVYDNSVTPKVPLCSTVQLSCSLFNITSSDLVITASNAIRESEAANVTKVVTHTRRRRDLRAQMSVNGSISAPVLDVTHAMSTVIFIEWSKVEAASFYSLLIIKQGSSHEHQQLTVYGESIALTDLRPNSTYCISVLAIYLDGSGPESEPVCVRTDQRVPQ